MTTDETRKAAEEWAEDALDADKDKLWNEIDSKLLGSLKSYEFRGSLWSDYGYDTYRWLMTMGFEAGVAYARRWVPCSERQPSRNDCYSVLADCGDGFRPDVCVFHNGEWDFTYGEPIIYWREIGPLPPKPEER